MGKTANQKIIQVQTSFELLMVTGKQHTVDESMNRLAEFKCLELAAASAWLSTVFSRMG
jgi:hypothetical protein